MTLAELVISSVSAMTLLAGLSSAIFIASQAASPNQMVTVSTLAGLTLDEIASELRTAKAFDGRSTTSVVFTVDDRSTDADSSDESIRYAWDGILGGSITRTYNNVTATVMSDVYDFALGYTVQDVVSNKRVLFIQGNVTGTNATYDNTRVQLMQGWGYTVIRKTTVTGTTQTELELAAATADVIYVSTTITPDDLGNKLKSTAKPVVIEEQLVADSFGLTSGDGTSFSDNRIKITDNTHYITSPFASGALVVSSVSVPLQKLSDTEATGLNMYAKPMTGSAAVFAILDSGGNLIDNTRATGHRIVVPWGGDGINPSDLNADALTLWRRTLDWATGTQAITAVELSIRTTSASGPVVQSRAELVGRPRP